MHPPEEKARERGRRQRVDGRFLILIYLKDFSYLNTNLSYLNTHLLKQKATWASRAENRHFLISNVIRDSLDICDHENIRLLEMALARAVVY